MMPPRPEQIPNEPPPLFTPEEQAAMAAVAAAFPHVVIAVQLRGSGQVIVASQGNQGSLAELGLAAAHGAQQQRLQLRRDESIIVPRVR